VQHALNKDDNNDITMKAKTTVLLLEYGRADQGQSTTTTQQQQQRQQFLSWNMEGPTRAD
jgi:hypothetical protein